MKTLLVLTFLCATILTQAAKLERPEVHPDNVQVNLKTYNAENSRIRTSLDANIKQKNELIDEGNAHNKNLKIVNKNIENWVKDVETTQKRTENFVSNAKLTRKQWGVVKATQEPEVAGNLRAKVAVKAAKKVPSGKKTASKKSGKKSGKKPAKKSGKKVLKLKAHIAAKKSAKKSGKSAKKPKAKKGLKKSAKGKKPSKGAKSQKKSSKGAKKGSKKPKSGKKPAKKSGKKSAKRPSLTNLKKSGAKKSAKKGAKKSGAKKSAKKSTKKSAKKDDKKKPRWHQTPAVTGDVHHKKKAHKKRPATKAKKPTKKGKSAKKAKKPAQKAKPAKKRALKKVRSGSRRLQAKKAEKTLESVNKEYRAQVDELEENVNAVIVKLVAVYKAADKDDSDAAALQKRQNATAEELKTFLKHILEYIKWTQRTMANYARLFKTKPDNVFKAKAAKVVSKIKKALKA